MHVLDTGHWGEHIHRVVCVRADILPTVQAEKPNEFLKLVVDFLKAGAGPPLISP